MLLLPNVSIPVSSRYHTTFSEDCLMIRRTSWSTYASQSHRFCSDQCSIMIMFQSMAGSNILSTAYGIEVLPSSDPYVAVAEDALDSIAKVAVPGAFLVESIPLLKYIPEWFPGTTHWTIFSYPSPLKSSLEFRCRFQAESSKVAEALRGIL